MGRSNLRAILHFTFLLGQTILTYCHLVEGSSLGTQVSMAGYHLFALLPPHVPCFTVGILIGVVTLSRGQGAGGTATPQSPKANDLLRGFTRGQCQLQKSRCGWGRGVVARGWGWGKLWSYGEVLYNITVSRSYGSSCLLDVVTVCHRWSGRGGLHN